MAGEPITQVVIMRDIVSFGDKSYLVSTVSTGGAIRGKAKKPTPIVWDTAVYPDTELGDYGDCPNCRRKIKL